jgi:hypothetical protein
MSVSTPILTTPEEIFACAFCADAAVDAIVRAKAAANPLLIFMPSPVSGWLLDGTTWQWPSTVEKLLIQIKVIQAANLVKLFN